MTKKLLTIETKTLYFKVKCMSFQSTIIKKRMNILSSNKERERGII